MKEEPTTHAAWMRNKSEKAAEMKFRGTSLCQEIEAAAARGSIYVDLVRMLTDEEGEMLRILGYEYGWPNDKTTRIVW